MMPGVEVVDLFMRVLFVSKHFPHDVRTSVSGVFQRMRMFIDAWKEIAQLDMLFYVPPEIDTSPGAVAAHESALRTCWDADLRLTLCPQSEPINGRTRWKSYAEGAVSLFGQPGYAETSGPMQVKVFDDLLERSPDAIFVHRLAAICPALLTQKRIPRVIFDLDDIEHVSLWRTAAHLPQWKGQLLYSSRLPALWWAERRAMKLAARTFVCSEDDRRYLEDKWRVHGVRTVPNGIEIPPPAPIPEAPTAMFVGSYRYHPNVQGAEFLLEKIWPKVLKSIPDAELWIVGAAPENIAAARRATPGVRVLGFVEDIKYLYDSARVVCCPIFSGGGTRIKILEAAAHGRPVVATRIGAEGLEMTDGKELLLRDDADSFAGALIALLRSAELCARLGTAAHRKTVERYDRREIVSLIRNYLQTN
jgi:glycosyltransferase involved in cell wall biosynthesis